MPRRFEKKMEEKKMAGSQGEGARMKGEGWGICKLP
jgi:hypothetical protein